MFKADSWKNVEASHLLLYKKSLFRTELILTVIQYQLLKSLRTEAVIRRRPLTLSRLTPLSYRNQSIDLLCKSMDWFLYDNGLRHERVKLGVIKNVGKSGKHLLL